MKKILVIIFIFTRLTFASDYEFSSIVSLVDRRFLLREFKPGNSFVPIDFRVLDAKILLNAIGSEIIADKDVSTVLNMTKEELKIILEKVQKISCKN